VAESSRLDDLRRRVQQDPSSIAFAQLAEEYRRASMFQEAVDVCRAGLSVHPSYLSARVTLGRALVELQQFDEAQHELEHVLQSAPENLAAIRGLADVYHRQGSLAAALAQYRAALALARHDPDLEQTISDLERQVEPKAPAFATEGLSFEQAAQEFLVHAPAPPPAAPAEPTPPPEAAAPLADPESERAAATVAALEQFLDAVHVVRAERHA
jgi:tetratricopeptide (TPR) repeat protein